MRKHLEALNLLSQCNNLILKNAAPESDRNKNKILDTKSNIVVKRLFLRIQYNLQH